MPEITPQSARLDLVEGYVELNGDPACEGSHSENLEDGDILSVGEFARVTLTIFSTASCDYIITVSGETTCPESGTSTSLTLENGVYEVESGDGPVLSCPRDSSGDPISVGGDSKYFIKEPVGISGTRG